jgi:hypothetical protein
MRSARNLRRPAAAGVDSADSPSLCGGHAVVSATTIALVTILALTSSRTALANHGPGASGGGSATISGETLKEGHFELSLREDYSQFEHFSRTAAAGRAESGGDFDALDYGFLTSVDFAYGVTDDFQVGGAIGYFAGRGFISADRTDDGLIEFGSANPEGLTDLVLTGKYRALRGQPGNLAVIAGVVLPTGRSDVKLSSAESLSPTDQPGTGRFGIPVGLGYSRFLTSRLTIDASALYNFRLEKDEFKVGDRFDAGIALAYRLTESIKNFPQYSLFVEANDVYLAKDRDHGEDDPDSGSNTLYLTPGFRVRFNPTASLTVAPSFPVIEHLNGNQGKVDFKVALTFSLSF